MQPTLEAELAGIRRSVVAVAGDTSLPRDVTGQLEAVIRKLERLERSSSRVLPYLVSDNDRIEQLLREIAPLLPVTITSEIDGIAPEGRRPDHDVADVAAANERNERLRDILARTVSAAPKLRERVVACLRESLEDRPW